jgi:uncharacterized protein
MTPGERQLITGLFDRMRGFGTPEKDRDAEALISERVRSTPDAPYMLVQSVLVQEHALQEAENRIRDLEDQVRDLQGTGQSRAPASGSFLGGLFGGGRPASLPSGTSVPPIGSRAAPSTYDEPQPYRAPGAAPMQPAAPPASGGFLRSAMATAAGVAGGVLAAGAIRDLMGGNQAQANTAAGNKEGGGSGTENASQQQASNADTGNVQNARDEQQTDKGRDDAQYEDAYDDSDSGWDDGGGGDFDI